MPTVPRETCRTPLEAQLWDECAAVEFWAARARELMEKISTVAAEVCRDPPRLSLADPGSHAHRIVMCMKAARARCSRRALTDEARRRAIERARELNALPADFDESSLPWKDPAMARAPAAAPEPEPRLVARPSDSLAFHVEPVLSETRPSERAHVRASHLTRLFARATEIRAPEDRVWASEIEPVIGPDGWVAYSNGRPAIRADHWHYPNGHPARQGSLFSRPHEAQPFLDIRDGQALVQYARFVLHRVASKLGAQVADSAWPRIKMLEEGDSVLALMQLELEAEIADRQQGSEAHAEHDTSDETRGRAWCDTQADRAPQLAAEATGGYQASPPPSEAQRPRPKTKKRQGSKKKKSKAKAKKTKSKKAKKRSR